MDRIVRLQIEKLPEGVYLATSEDVQGLIVQGDTLREVLDFVPDLVGLLDQFSAEDGSHPPRGEPVPDKLEIPFIIAA